MILKDLRVHIRNSYLIELSFFRLVNSDLFSTVYEKIDDDEKKEIKDTMITRNRKNLNKILNKLMEKYRLLDLMPMTELRVYAKQLKISNYSILTKSRLLELIYEKENKSIT